MDKTKENWKSAEILNLYFNIVRNKGIQTLQCCYSIKQIPNGFRVWMAWSFQAFLNSRNILSVFGSRHPNTGPIRYLFNIRELKQATFLSSAGSKPRRYRWRVMASAVLVWNQQRQSFSFNVRDFKRERLTPSFAIYNDAVYFRLTSVLTKTSLA